MLLYHEVDGKQTKGSAFAAPTVNKDCTLLVPRFFDESDHCIDDALIDDGLDVCFGPVEGQEAHAFDGGVVLALAACAVDYMRDLVEGQPFDILSNHSSTWAMMSSPIKMQSVTFVGIETSSCP